MQLGLSAINFRPIHQRGSHAEEIVVSAFSHDVIIYPILQCNAAWRFCTTSIIN